MDEAASNPVETTATLALFPTDILATQLKRSVYEPINRDILSRLDLIRAARPELGAAGKWQTDQDLHRHPELAGLVALIRAAVTEICDSLTLVHEGFEITGCWANVTSRGHSHRRHAHPNNYLSGVYYVRAGKGADGIDFHDPRTQVGLIAPPARDQSRANPDTFTLRVSEGTLLIFPAWLEHSVPVHQGEGQRISVAFNVMFPSFGTVMARPLWTATAPTDY